MPLNDANDDHRRVFVCLMRPSAAFRQRPNRESHFESRTQRYAGGCTERPDNSLMLGFCGRFVCGQSMVAQCAAPEKVYMERTCRDFVIHMY